MKNNFKKLFSKKALLLFIFVLLILLIIPKDNNSTNTHSGKLLTQEVPPNSPPCTIKNARLLDQGRNPHFSPSNDKLVYSKFDEKNVYQIFTSNLDGTSQECLSCKKVSNSPDVSSHKTGPTFHPSGKFILLSAEMDNHPASFFSKNKILSELFVNGLWSNIYAVTLDGKSWHKLTNYSTEKEDGAMHINISPDGTKIAWSRMQEKATSQAPFGKWRLMIAEFKINNSIPSLSNIQDITPQGGQLLEAHGFSPDNRFLLFTGDMEKTHNWDMDIWKMDLTSGELSNLTKGSHWEEHASFTPNGKKIAYMSSSSDPIDPFFKSELFLMNQDGSNKKQITHFNSEGFLESQQQRSMATDTDWNNDGTIIALTQQLSNQYPSSQIWVLEFAGKCGE